MTFTSRIRSVAAVVAVAALAAAAPAVASSAKPHHADHGNHCGQGHVKHAKALGKTCTKNPAGNTRGKQVHGSSAPKHSQHKVDTADKTDADEVNDDAADNEADDTADNEAADDD